MVTCDYDIESQSSSERILQVAKVDVLIKYPQVMLASYAMPCAF
jgi:hypothetical protein